MRYVLYGNGSCENHGCEAIVRGTKMLLDGNPRIHSIAAEIDKKYGLDQVTEIVSARTKVRRNLQFLYAYLKMRIMGNYLSLDLLEYKSSIQKARKKNKVALSVGGDNYCYEGTEIYGYLNKEYKKNNFKTVLWGCSIEPEIVVKREMVKDLKRYDLVVARESITYEAVEKVGANVILAPDPAFFMKPQVCDIDSRILSKNVIGINISPHILKCAKDSELVYKNYLELIKYILKETDNIIALIPHVVWKENDDRKILEKLYEDSGKSDRVVLVEDHTAPELKYIISKCNMFVGARTHATIAAYSSFVPTLVVGYSVKARGIARDLFGNERNYVIPVQELENLSTLKEMFQWMNENAKQIRDHLKKIMPEYVSKGLVAKQKVLELENE